MAAPSDCFYNDPRALAINRSLVENPAAMRRKVAELRKAHVGR